MEKKKKATTKKVVTKKIENKAEKKVEKVVIPKLDKTKTYTFISNGKAPRLPKGSVWHVTGESAEIFLKAGYGKLKED